MTTRPSEVLATLVGMAADRNPTRGAWLYMMETDHCKLCDADHAEEDRQYMHVGHVDRTICYASATLELGLPWVLGLMIHEIGHLWLVDAGRKHTEGEANEAGRLITGIRVQFKGPRVLEWARPTAEFRRSLRGS